MITGETKLAAVFANPIKHSLSPFIHNQAFHLTNEPGVYLAFEIEEASLKQSIEMIRTWQMYGANLSMPYKRLSLPLLDRLSPTAAFVGAVNTIVNDNGQLVGHNTDGAGFIAALKEKGYSLFQKRVVILGAGGAALAIIAELTLTQKSHVTVIFRRHLAEDETRKKIAEIAAAKQVTIAVVLIEEALQFEAALKEADIIVNATSVGMKTEHSLVPKRCLNKQQLVVDIIYQPLETRLIKEAKACGCQVENGIGMLVHQAAKSFELWTHKKMPVATIEKALIARIKEINK